MKIDAFCHIVTPRYVERLRRTDFPGVAVMERRLATAPSLLDLDRRLAMIERFGDYVQVLSLGRPALEAIGGPALARELAMIANDELAELVRSRPETFPGFVAGLPMNDPDAAVAEAERAITTLGAVGVQVYSNVNGMPLDEGRFEPLFETMARLDRPIWLHPARTSDHPDYPTETRSKHELWWLFGWPYETAAAMTRLVFSKVLDRHPGLKVIAHHGGSMVPYFAGRLARLDSYGLRSHPDELVELLDGGALPVRRPIDEFRSFYADTALFGSKASVECALDFFGVDHMLFATDSPFCDEDGATFVRDTIADVDALDVSDADRARIYAGNLRDLVPVPALA